MMVLLEIFMQVWVSLSIKKKIEDRAEHAEVMRRHEASWYK